MTTAADDLAAGREKRWKRIPTAPLDAEQRSSLAWAFAQAKIRQGEGLREALLWALRYGARLSDDLESRARFVDALEGKLEPKRGRGRPRKRERWSMARAAVEHGIAETYGRWLDDFKRDRELAWLRYEAQRLRQEQPHAAVSLRRLFDLGTETGRQSYAKALSHLGARPCPSATLQAAETPRELALRATVEEYSQRWADVAGKPLTPSIVARILTRAEKSRLSESALSGISAP